MREPFWRSQTQYWYVEQHGKQVRLSKLGDKDPDGATRKYPPPAVQNEWHRMMREGVPEDLQLGDLFAAFLASLPEGSDNHVTTRRQLGRFERFAGKEMRVSKLRPIKLTEYLKTKPQWGPSSVRTFVNRLHAALNWGVRQGLLDKNPISSTPGYKREGRHRQGRSFLSRRLTMLPRPLRPYRFKFWQVILPVGFCVGILVSPALLLLAGVLAAVLAVVIRDVVRGV